MLGVIGGMGPVATADFYVKLLAATPARCDEDHIPALIHSVPQLPSRPAALLRDGASPLPDLIVARDRLLAAGATLLAMPCNTAHHWYEALTADCDVPFVHIVDAVAAELPASAKRLGIIATAATLAAGIYARRLDAGIEWLAPDDATFSRAVQPCIDAVKCNAAADGARLLEPVVQALLQRGAQRVILACTELPVAAAAGSGAWREPCVDSTAALARACVRAWAARTDAAAVGPRAGRAA